MGKVISKKDKIEKKISIDVHIAPVLEYMLKKANLDLSELNDTFIKVWINQNLDLLTDIEKKNFNIS